jgi:hypothetical protein
VLHESSVDVDASHPLGDRAFAGDQ